MKLELTPAQSRLLTLAFLALLTAAAAQIQLHNSSWTNPPGSTNNITAYAEK